MKRNHVSIAAAIFAAAAIASGTAVAQSSGTTRREPVNPNISGRDTSTGGTQSERTQSGTPLSEGSRFSGTVEMDQPNLREDVKTAQQALQDKGYNPGPVDGMIGPRTREALKSFQTASGLETTGTLNPATAEKLGVESGSSKDSKDSKNMNTGKNSSR